MANPNETNEVEVQIDGLPPPSTTEAAAEIVKEAHLQIGSGRDRQTINLNFVGAQLLVGRADEQTHVEIDLVPFGAFDYGVSRRHAALLRRTEGIYVEDLCSTNGTRINGFALRSNKAYRLRHGDEIEFGRLRTSIRFTL